MRNSDFDGGRFSSWLDSYWKEDMYTRYLSLRCICISRLHDELDHEYGRIVGHVYVLNSHTTFDATYCKTISGGEA